MKISPNDKVVRLRPFQDKFLFAKERFPALVSGVGTGKTFMLLLKIWNHCEEYPGSLAMIVRKEFTDLRDSTIKDFTRYFGVTIDSNKEYKFPNGSIIMFRHGAELNVLKNISLSICGIEQAEEFDSEETFTFLRDRMRHPIGTSQLCIIANCNGDNWIKKYWKNGALQNALLVEASTFDNAENLRPDFIADQKQMAIDSPAHYRQYVLNDWDVADTEFVLIRPQSIDALKGREIFHESPRRIFAGDPATGGDECVGYVIEDGSILYQRIMHENDTTKIGAEWFTIGREWDCSNWAIDSIGVGKGVADTVNRLATSSGIDNAVEYINSAESSSDPERWNNKRTEMWWYLMEQINNKEIPYPEDDELRRQLQAVKYLPLRNRKQVKLEPKELTKKRLGRSPDRADAYVYGVYALQFVQGGSVARSAKIDKYKIQRPLSQSGLTVCNF